MQQRPNSFPGTSKANKRQKLSLQVARELSDTDAYVGQQKVTLRLEGSPTLLSTTAATGVIANVTTLGPANITGFATRFGSTFDEYRVLGADIRITPVSASTGVSKCWIDEQLSAAPTSNESQERVSWPLANTNATPKSQTIVRWRARDLKDLQYTAIGSNAAPAYFKLYTDSATWGASTTATPLWLIEPTFIVEFRGIKST